MKRLLFGLVLACLAGLVAVVWWSFPLDGTFRLPVGSCAKVFDAIVLIVGHERSAGPAPHDYNYYEYFYRSGRREGTQVRQFNRLAKPVPCPDDVQDWPNRAAQLSEDERLASETRRRKQEEWLEQERRAYRTITEMCGDVLPAWWGTHAAVISPSNKQVAECLEKWQAQAERK